MSAASAVDWAALEQAAKAARAHAHAPYSGYEVGAAVLTSSGHVHAGANVENASYGLSLCAERSAIARMVVEGDKDVVAVVVVTRGPRAAAPCGLCRQTLAEFGGDDLPIRLVVADGSQPPRETTLGALLPDAFRATALRP